MIQMDRTNAVSQAFLRWAHRNRRDSSPNAQFLEAPDSTVEGQQVAADELEDVLELLLHRGLIDGPMTFTQHLPDPVELTRDGVVCVIDDDGDVQRWNAGKRMSYINQPVTVTGQGNAALSAAAAKVSKAIDDLRAAQKSGDFEAYGKALAALDQALKEFQAASAAAGTPGPTPSPSPSG